MYRSFHSQAIRRCDPDQIELICFDDPNRDGLGELANGRQRLNPLVRGEGLRVSNAG
jgi:hypothetical protein